MISRDTFVKYTRDALRQLYDPSQLIQNPLVYMCGLRDRPDAFVVLQEIIIEAIEGLKPDPKTSRHTSREIFALLYNRYVQQLNQKAVAEQLGMSVRHLRRREYAAIDVLAAHLWSRVDPDLVATYEVGQGQENAARADSSLGTELTWLQSLPSTSVTADLSEILSSVMDFIKNLASQYRVALDIQINPAMPMIAVHPVVLDQILVNLLTGALHQLATGQIGLSTQVLVHEVTLVIQGNSSRHDAVLLASEIQAPLETAQKLADLCHLPMTLDLDIGHFKAVMHLPRTEEIAVLVIDDNADTLQLFNRYVATTPYRVLVTQNPLDVYDLVAEASVQAIILDVMMPQIDGWRMLSQLRQHPATAHIPIVVCTILPQQELAFSLGAADFLQKPASREAFLDTLNRLFATQAAKPASPS